MGPSKAQLGEAIIEGKFGLALLLIFNATAFVSVPLSDHRYILLIELIIFIIIPAFVLLAGQSQKLDRWLLPLALITLVGSIVVGLFFVLLASAINTGAGRWITVLAWVDAVCLSHLFHRRTLRYPSHCTKKLSLAAMWCIIVLSSWSWMSALVMVAHATSLDGSERCLLLGGGYDRPASIFELRGTVLYSGVTGPTGTLILDFHAVLIEPDDADQPISNWSKVFMTFTPIGNVFVPSGCPA